VRGRITGGTIGGSVVFELPSWLAPKTFVYAKIYNPADADCWMQFNVDGKVYVSTTNNTEVHLHASFRQ
jgi:hypothetical protein